MCVCVSLPPYLCVCLCVCGMKPRVLLQYILYIEGILAMLLNHFQKSHERVGCTKDISLYWQVQLN